MRRTRQRSDHCYVTRRSILAAPERGRCAEPSAIGELSSAGILCRLAADLTYRPRASRTVTERGARGPVRRRTQDPAATPSESAPDARANDSHVPAPSGRLGHSPTTVSSRLSVSWPRTALPGQPGVSGVAWRTFLRSTGQRRHRGQRVTRQPPPPSRVSGGHDGRTTQSRDSTSSGPVIGTRGGPPTGTPLDPCTWQSKPGGPVLVADHAAHTRNSSPPWGSGDVEGEPKSVVCG